MRNAWLPGLCAAVVMAGARAWGADPGNLGARLYTERCSPCHGDSGRGDGPTAPALQPPPRDFSEAAFWKGRPMAQLRAVVKGGKPGTMMPPFEGVLSDAEIDAVVESLRRFDPTASGAGSAK
jgi:mono/diheme cytochrome c family protein